VHRHHDNYVFDDNDLVAITVVLQWFRIYCASIATYTDTNTLTLTAAELQSVYLQ